MNSWKILSVAALCLMQDRLPYEGSCNPAVVVGKLDLTCLLKTWKIKGVLFCPWHGHTKPCLWVENAYPCGLLEVVRQAGKSHLATMPGIPLRRSTSGHNENGLQFAETRVFTFVPPLISDLDIPIAAPRGPAFMLSYVSELDPTGWRRGVLESLLARPGMKDLGAWGCSVPRTGYVEQPSEPIAAHLQAVRAGKIAAFPLGHVILTPHSWEPRLGHFMQMVSPVVRPCVSVGHPDLRSLESGAVSPHGAYLFVQWGLFETCKRCLPTRFLPPRPPVS